MKTNPYKELEEIFPRVVNLMPEDQFDSHDFILKLAQKYQNLYIQALYQYRNQNRPFHRVHMALAKRLKKRRDLVEHVDNKPSANIFGEESTVAVWRKVR